jgi:dUTPase
MSQIPINVKRLKENAKLPEYATPGSHCFDLRVSFEWNDKVECFSLTAGGRSIGHIYPEKLACRGIGLTLYPNHVYKLPTGLKFEIPYGYGMKVFIRSSLAYRHGMTLVKQTPSTCWLTETESHRGRLSVARSSLCFEKLTMFCYQIPELVGSVRQE